MRQSRPVGSELKSSGKLWSEWAALWSLNPDAMFRRGFQALERLLRGAFLLGESVIWWPLISHHR